MEHRTTNVEISIDEDDQRTEARASVRIREREFHGWGRARRNPRDPNIPMIGEELALARALSSCSSSPPVARKEQHPRACALPTIPNDLGLVRQRETEAAAGLLGVARVVFLGYHDSGMMGEPPTPTPGRFGWRTSQL